MNTAGTEAQRVIVAEDDPDLRDMLGDALRRIGYEPDLHPDAASALEAGMHRPPALYLFDVGLPGMSGIDACRTVKHSPHLCRPVLLISAQFPAHQVHDARAAGADSLLAKPFTLTQLTDSIRQLIA